MNKREIKFRAWDFKLNKMKHPALWDSTMPSNWKDHYVLQQYTGLSDKNGKEIYEGDIVKRNDGVIKCVFYNEKQGGFYTKFHNGVGFQDPISYATDRACEVIGNEFETPELLK